MKIEDILRKVENPLTDDTVREILRRYCDTEYLLPDTEQLDFYKKIVRYNKNNLESSRINEEDKKKFISIMFSFWKNTILSLTAEEIKQLQLSGKYDDDIYQLKSYLENMPKDLTLEQIDKIGNNSIANKYGWISQNDEYIRINSSKILGNKNSMSYPQHRLYLNVALQDVYIMAALFTYKCQQYNIPYIFKFTKKQEREDSFIIYSTHEYFNSYLKILAEIKKERKDIIERCKKPPLLVGKIDDVIGYGSEPLENKISKESKKSYNILRCRIIEEAIKDTTNKWILENLNKIIEYNGKKISLEDYIVLEYSQVACEFVNQWGLTGYTKEQTSKEEFKDMVFNTFMKYKKEIINHEEFSPEPFYKPTAIEIKKINANIILEIIKINPEYIEMIKENIKKKGEIFGIDPNNFAFNKEERKKLTNNMSLEEFIKIKDSLEQKFIVKAKEEYTLYTKDLERLKEYSDKEKYEKITIEQNEKKLLSYFGNLYKEYLQKIDEIKREYNITEKKTLKDLEKEPRILIIFKELYKNYIDMLMKLKKIYENINSIPKEKEEPIPLPSLEDIEDLRKKYVIEQEKNTGRKIFKNIETGQIEIDPITINNIMFAYLWTKSASINEFANDTDGYAFNDGARKTYEYFWNKVILSLKTTGKLDSIELYKGAQLLDYKYAQEIIVHLLKNNHTVKLIEMLLKDRKQIKEGALENTTILLGDIYYVEQLINSNNPLNPKQS